MSGNDDSVRNSKIFTTSILLLIDLHSITEYETLCFSIIYVHHKCNGVSLLLSEVLRDCGRKVRRSITQLCFAPNHLKEHILQYSLKFTETTTYPWSRC